MSLFSLSLALFLIIDPFGSIKSFIRCLEGIPASRRKVIIAREMFIALGCMLAFNFLGDYIFKLLQISETTVYFASGIILFITAIGILFPKQHSVEQTQLEGEPFLVPLAIPMISGPAVLATVMLYAGSEPSPWTMIFAILIAWGGSSIILLCSKQLLRLLSVNGLTACEKLMGMVLILLAVDRLLQGVVHFLHPL